MCNIISKNRGGKKSLEKKKKIWLILGVIITTFLMISSVTAVSFNQNEIAEENPTEKISAEKQKKYSSEKVEKEIFTEKSRCSLCNPQIKVENPDELINMQEITLNALKQTGFLNKEDDYWGCVADCCWDIIQSNHWVKMMCEGFCGSCIQYPGPWCTTCVCCLGGIAAGCIARCARDNDDSPCFAGETQVLMGDGTYKKIEDIQVGDIVKAYDEEEMNYKNVNVEQVIYHPEEEMGGNYLVINEWLKVTPNHLLQLENKAWKKAGDIEKNDELLNTRSNGVIAVTSIEKINRSIPVYDLDVESEGDYIVGNTETNTDIGVLKHGGGFVTFISIPIMILLHWLLMPIWIIGGLLG
jgi:hypothetical protein